MLRLMPAPAPALVLSLLQLALARAALPPPTYIDVTTDLGTNNPSVQVIGNERYYNFARGDAGWISAFEAAEAAGLRRIYFPTGQYFFGGSSNASCAAVDIEPRNGLCYAPTVVNANLYPSLSQGVEVFGDGGGATVFHSWAPIASGSALTLTANSTVATAYWSVHDIAFSLCATGFALAFNDPGRAAPRNEYNTLHVSRISAWNGLVNNTCDGGAPWAVRPGQARTNSAGGVFFGHIWSSTLSVDEVAVQSGAPTDEFNDTAAVLLDEVQYSTLDLRGLGTGLGSAFSSPDPTNAWLYNGWGLIMRANVYANTVTQLHVEIAGGGALIKASSAENVVTSAIFSMMFLAAIVQLDANADGNAPQFSGNNVFEAVAINQYPVDGKLFSSVVEGNRSALVVRSVYTFPYTRLANDFNIGGPLPASSLSPCVRGEQRLNEDFLFLCVADGLWRRVALEAF